MADLNGLIGRDMLESHLLDAVVVGLALFSITACIAYYLIQRRQWT
jgi:hypothetical protein